VGQGRKGRGAKTSGSPEPKGGRAQRGHPRPGDPVAKLFPHIPPVPIVVDSAQLAFIGC
jgi:hypothetical protein